MLKSTVEKLKEYGKLGGRPRGSFNKKTIAVNELKEKAKELLESRILEEFEQLLDARLDLAKGTYYEKTQKNQNGENKVRIYQRTPDNTSLDYFFSWIIGKPENEPQLAPASTQNNLVLWGDMGKMTQQLISKELFKEHTTEDIPD